ncbi:MAG: right-handed parallel beta-helix repeat-containing protein [Candidatus Bipolaricaulia bacterium]
MAKRTRLNRQQTEKHAQRRLAVWCGWIPLALLAFVIATGVVGSAESGPTTLVVDSAATDSEDTDRDARFRTIQAALNTGQPAPYATVKLAPGRYEVGELALATEGLTLTSTSDPSQTALVGQLTIDAPNVQVDGLTVEAASGQTAVTIRARGVGLQNVRVAGGHHGIEVASTHGINIGNSTVYNQGSDGIVLREAWDVQISNSETRGNSGLGILMEDARNITLTGNTVAFNGLGGIWARRSEGLVVRSNDVRDNSLVGVALQRTSGTEVAKNDIASNEAGILLMDAGENTVRNNTLQSQRTVGVVLKNGARGNTVKANTIRGTQGQGAIGVRLSGNVASNRVIDNKIVESGSGVVLVSNDSGAPSNNLFQGNEIARTDGVGVTLSEGARRNRFVENAIHDNLDAGVRSQGDANAYKTNELAGNGTVGIALNGSRDASLQGNRIHHNGSEGVKLTNTTAVFAKGNEVRNNGRAGVKIKGGQELRLLRNTLAKNGTDGLVAADAQTLVLMGNTVRANANVGLAIRDAQDVDIQGNHVDDNGSGGIQLANVQGADIASNQITENLRFGLRVGKQSTDVSAHRNYWGDASGPAGAFAGNGNAVLGLAMTDVTPWLPAKPDKLAVDSVSSLVLESPQSDRITYDAGNRVGLELAFFNLGRDGRQELLTKGVILAARYQQPPEKTPPMDKELGFYTINVDGADTGKAELTLFYKESDQPPGLDPDALRIFTLEDGTWKPLKGASVDPELKRVTGTIDVSKLDGQLIGLGTMQSDTGPTTDLLPPIGLGTYAPPVAGGLASLLVALIGYLGVTRWPRTGEPIVRWVKALGTRAR